MDTLVFDTGPLSAFARADLLGVLEAVVGDRSAVVPSAVIEELERGVDRDYRIRSALDAEWLVRRRLESVSEQSAFERFATPLVSRGRNVGDAEVLALADTIPGIAVVDDGPARRLARRTSVRCVPTLKLLYDAICDGLLTIDLVSHMADALLATEYRLPFKPGGFIAWANEEGLFSGVTVTGPDPVDGAQ